MMLTLRLCVCVQHSVALCTHRSEEASSADAGHRGSLTGGSDSNTNVSPIEWPLRFSTVAHAAPLTHTAPGSFPSFAMGLVSEARKVSSDLRGGRVADATVWPMREDGDTVTCCHTLPESAQSGEDMDQGLWVKPQPWAPGASGR